jgi:hypothetical protein
MTCRCSKLNSQIAFAWYRRAQCYCVALMVASTLQTIALAQPAETEAPVSSATKAAVAIPLGMTRNDFARIGKILKLSDEQQQFASVAYESYQASYAQLETQILPALDKLAVDVGVDQKDGYTPRSAALYQELHSMQEKVRESVGELDQKFFVGISAILSETQLEMLPRVQQIRERGCCFPLYILLQPAQIDLSRFIDEMMLEEEARNKIDPILIEYEIQATQSFKEVRKALDKATIEGVWALSNALFDSEGRRRVEGSNDAVTSGQLYFERTKTLRGNLSRLERRLANLNATFCEQILDQLGPSERERVEYEFKRRAYPDVFPDATNAISTFDFAMKTSSIPDVGRSTLELAWADHERSYDEKCKVMIDLTLEHREELERTMKNDGVAEYESRMQALHLDRLRLNRSILKFAVEALKGNLSKEAALAIDEHLRVIQDRERLLGGDIADK